MTTQERIDKMLKKSEAILNAGKQTNEEWFCQLPTEEKAKWLASECNFVYECGLSNAIPKIMHEEEWEYWLQEKHI